MNVYTGVSLFALIVAILSWLSTFGAAMLSDWILDRQYGEQGSTGFKRRTENGRAIAAHLSTLGG
jgi:hypothetical protein